MSDTGMVHLSVGDRVRDTDDDDPNVGVVVWTPPEMTIADWEFPTGEGTTTAAETNPEYAADSQLVVVTFEADLDGYWEDWRDADSNSLFEGVRENGVHHYGFPEGRLAHVEDGDSSDAATSDENAASTEPDDEVEFLDAFPDIAERLEQNEFAVEYDAGEAVLRVEKHGIEHAIEHDGTIQGESGIKSRVSVIVNRFM